MPEAQTDKPTVLVTGFATVPGQKTNPSGELLPLLAADPPERVDLRTQLLPAGQDAALLKAVEAMDRLLPDAVLCLGAAVGPPILSIERVAVNLNELEAAARRGAVRNEPIDAAGPDAYFATLPVHAMMERIRAAGVPAAISSSAGTQLCNRLFYALLHYVSLRGQETWFKKMPPAGLVSRIGLMRLPLAGKTVPARGKAVSTQGKSGPPLTLDTSLHGVRLAIEAITAFLESPESKPAELSSASE